MTGSIILKPSSRVLVIGASGGIGQACAIAAGNICGMMNVTPVSRAADGLDITDESSILETFANLQGPYDLVLIATGALTLNGAGPEKSLSNLTTDTMMAQFLTNSVGPALVLKHIRPLLPKTSPCLIAALSARVGSVGDNRLGGWVSYRAAKSALNQIVHTAAIEFSRTHPASICVALHPGTVRTSLTQKYLANHPSVPPIEAARNILSVLNNLSPKDTGLFFDWAGKPVPW